MHLQYVGMNIRHMLEKETASLMICLIDAPSLFDPLDTYRPGGGKQDPVRCEKRRDAGGTGQDMKPPAHTGAPTSSPIGVAEGHAPWRSAGACRSAAANPALVSPVVHSSRRPRGLPPRHDQVHWEGRTSYTVTGSGALAAPVRYAAQQERPHADERKWPQRPQRPQMGLGVPQQHGSEHAAFHVGPRAATPAAGGPNPIRETR